MAIDRNPKRNEAYKLYAESLGRIDLNKLAETLDVPYGTLRGWKSKDKWDIKMMGTVSVPVEQTERNTEEQVERSYSWIDLEKEYVTDISKKPISLVKMAEKYGIPKQTIFDHSAKNKWTDKRKAYKDRTLQKVVERVSNKDADRITRLLSVTDKAMDKIEKAVEELEQYTVSSKRKRTEKIKLLDESTGREIGITESSHEEVEYSTVDGIVDKEGIMYITNSLKNIKDLYSITKNIEEQDARIANLKSKTTDSDDGEETGVILLAPVLEEVEDEQ